MDIVPGTLGQMIYTTHRARSGWRRDVLILLVKMELSWCRVHHVSDLVSQKSTPAHMSTGRGTPKWAPSDEPESHDIWR